MAYIDSKDISPEDVKRWFQLLVGKGKQSMREDITSTLNSKSKQDDPLLNKFIIREEFNDKRLNHGEILLYDDVPSLIHDVNVDLKEFDPEFKGSLSNVDDVIRVLNTNLDGIHLYIKIAG